MTSLGLLLRQCLKLSPFDDSATVNETDELLL